MVKLDRTSTIPLYRQLATALQQKIQRGEYPAGSKLPPERELATQLNVNRSTVMNAYDELVADGLVERRRGSGTWVCASSWHRTPQWQRYVDDGSFLANPTLSRKLRTATFERPLINLASGELANELMPRNALQTIAATMPFLDSLQYVHPFGYEPLRAAIVEHLREWKQIEATADSVLITSGAQQALYLIASSLLRAGDAVAIEQPSYCSSLPLFQQLGIRVFPLPVDERGAQVEQLEELHRQHRLRLVFLNPDYQNPTGTVLSAERRQLVLSFSQTYGVPIVEDDPYSLTSFDGTVHRSLKAMDSSGNVLYVSSLSKVVASGLRIGWIVGPRHVLERLADVKQQIDFGHSIIPQWLAGHFLTSDAFTLHLQQLRHGLAERLHHVSKLLAEANATFHVPAGGIHLWLPVDDETKRFQQLMAEGIAVTPGQLFQTPGHLRLTYGRLSQDDLLNVASRLIGPLK